MRSSRSRWALFQYDKSSLKGDIWIQARTRGRPRGLCELRAETGATHPHAKEMTGYHQPLSWGEAWTDPAPEPRDEALISDCQPLSRPCIHSCCLSPQLEVLCFTSSPGRLPAGAKGSLGAGWAALPWASPGDGRLRLMNSSPGVHPRSP